MEKQMLKQELLESQIGERKQNYDKLACDLEMQYNIIWLHKLTICSGTSSCFYCIYKEHGDYANTT